VGFLFSRQCYNRKTKLLFVKLHKFLKGTFMQQAPTIFVILLGLSAILSVYLAAWGRMHSRVPGAREFTLFQLCVAIYSVGYAIEISRSDIKGVLEAINLEYVGLTCIPVFILLFSLRLLRGKSTSTLGVILLLVIPAITLFIVWTQKYHSLFYINPRIISTGLYPALAFERGVWYYIYITYLLASIFVSVQLLIIHAFRSPQHQKNQAITIAVSSIFPIFSTIFYYLGWIPYQIDPGPFSLTLTGVVFAFTLFKLRLFELVPAARELALDSIRDAFLVVDRQGRLLDLNKAALGIPGANSLKIGELLADDRPVAKNLQPLLQNGKDDIQFSTFDPEGGNRCYQARAFPIMRKQERIDGMAILISDVTETAGLLRQLSYQANIDGLTGVLNRRQLMDLGAKEVETARRTGLPLGVILVDLDHFKTLNDTYGHATGDDALKKVAECFRKGLRSVDLLGRYGGEEFAAILPGTDLQSTVKIAERLLCSLANCTIMHKGELLRITASFGAHSAHAADGTTIDELLKIADLALYQAKTNGRNQVAWSSS
jgi:diguanylate cyclase (GGDEF)-like protein